MPRPDNLVKVEVKKNDVKVETEPEKDNSEEMVNNTNDSNNSKVEANTTQSVSGSGNSSGHTFLTVEELPSFPACKGLPRNQQMQCFEEQLRKAVSKNLSYPEDDYESGRQGRAYVEFTINEEGEFSDVKIIESKGAMATKEMNKAAERAVKKLKKINPAKQGNTPVKVKYTLPVTFRIQ
jgi:TonB family protein